MDILIAGGGTGGHLFPGLALAEALRVKESKARILFVGSAHGIEVKAVPRAGFALKLIPVLGLKGKSLWNICRSLLRLPLALLVSLGIIIRFRPDIAISVGGYAAGPVILAAWLLRVPCIVLEQNVVPGITNKILGLLAKKIITTLPTTKLPLKKTLVLGNPVRADFLAVRNAPYRLETLNTEAWPLKLLVFGGSQGAKALNDVVVEIVSIFKQRFPLKPLWQIVHQTGASDYERVVALYKEHGLLAEVKVYPFIDDMAKFIGEADLVLARAGASTLAELTVCGRPAILVPFPAATDDHQTANARVLVAAKAAILLPQATLTAASLSTLLQDLATEPQYTRLRALAKAASLLGKPTATADILQVLAESVRKKA